MDNLTTSRFKLPLLAPGQAHKELFHNEAIARLDILCFPLVEGIENDPDTLSPLVGQCWIVGSLPVSSWVNKVNNLASWTEGGWRFIEPVPQMTVRLVESDEVLMFRANDWQYPPNVQIPSGGALIDSEARETIDSILLVLKQAGIVS